MERYEVIRPLGAGGMSEVYLAHDLILERNVAIKRLRDQFVNDKTLLSQFEREARSAAQLVHPNIVGIYDVIDDVQDQFIVMEYVDGHTLKEILAGGALSPERAIHITTQLAAALAHAHSHNVVHCDIKPQNILMAGDRVPKIADFGIAKMVSSQTLVYTTSVLGSVHYISPEQATGEAVTAASDIYSLGIVLFEMLTGRVPFDGDTAVAVAMMQVEKKIPPLADFVKKVPEGLQAVLDKMTAKNPKDRYASAQLLYEDLLMLESGQDPAVQPVTAGLDGETIVMPRVQAHDYVSTGEGQEEKAEGKKIISVDIDKDAMAKKAKSVKEKIEDYISNFRFTYNRVIVLLTLLVMLISLGAHFFFKHDNMIVAVPGVVNMQLDEARKMLELRDYKVELQEETSLEAKEGVVLRQIPPAGERRRKGSTVKLTFSVGAEKHTMPDLEALSLIKAQQTLDAVKLRVGKIERKYSNSYRIGTVISQKPAAGEEVPEGSLVDLIINEGDRKLPNLVGMQMSEAEKILRNLGLRMGEVRRVNSSDARGTITAVSPAAGMMLPAYYPVHLTVSDGPDSSVVAGVFEYTVPGNSSEKHRIQIYKIDRKGRTLVYSSTDAGGKYIKQTVDTTNGKVTIVVYCDGRQVEETGF